MADLDVTDLLAASREGDAEATDRLLAAVYDELRTIAAAYRARNNVGATLSTTELLHEAYLKLVDGGRLPFNGRAHFFGAAARAMRQVVVDAARARSRDKRGGGTPPIRLDDAPPIPITAPIEAENVIALDRALARFEHVDARAARVVECRYFAGLTIEETADALDVSTMTVKRDWAAARAWLHHALSEP
jgi:RNA polymerase sigma-70 factor (ECF subfamily)